ncbi:MAG: hypothetical protein N3G20_04565, partial [Verrucomicrobiae bacterium]|nr:hypothetical protein [Verrucomicrobiae bacterium]
RAVAQLLANMGATFAVDERIFYPLDRGPLPPEEAWQVSITGDRAGPQATGPNYARKTAENLGERSQPLPSYHPDYRTDFPMGDNPYRYYRW